MSRSLVILFALLLIAGLTITACGDDTGGSDSTAPASPFEQVLSHIPDTPESRTATKIYDVAKIRAELGIESPGSDATFEEVSQNIMDVMSDARKMAGINFRASIGGDGFEEWLSGFNAIAYEATETTAGSLGFDIRNVDQFAIFGDRMFGGEVLLGKFDPEVTKAVFDHFGRGGRILVMDGMAARTLSHDPMQQIIDASTDVQPSLADDPNYIMAANLLTKFGTAGALFSGDSENVEQAIARLEDMWGDGLATLATADEVRDQFAQAHLIEAYEVAALGTAFPAGEGESPNT